MKSKAKCKDRQNRLWMSTVRQVGRGRPAGEANGRDADVGNERVARCLLRRTYRHDCIEEEGNDKNEFRVN
jgi:hypothetical protein